MGVGQVLPLGATQTKSLLFLITAINDESTFPFRVSFSHGENLFQFRLGCLKSLSVFLSH